MGSRLSTAVRAHKAAVLERVTISRHEQHLIEPLEKAHGPGQTANDARDVSTTTDISFAPPASTPPDTTAMDIDSRPRTSTESRSETIVRDSEQLPGVLADDDPPPPPPPPPPPEAVEQQPPALPSCLICCTPCDGPDKSTPKSIHPCSKCGLAYCIPCVKGMFLEACKDLSRMPPRCCNQIPIHHIRSHLTEEEVALFKSKYEEWGTRNPFYCPVARCSVFIPNHRLPRAGMNGKGKQRVDSGIGTPTTTTVSCPNCEADICTSCRKLAHRDETCSPLEFHGIDAETAELLKKWGYKKCPKCGNGVKRMFGCSHMECRCGAHFCWVCMEGRNTCAGYCDDEDDEDDEEEEEEEFEDIDEDNDENDVMDTHPEVESDAEEEDKSQAEVPTLFELGVAHEFPHMTSKSEAEITPATTTDDDHNESLGEKSMSISTGESASPSRVRNLDGGPSSYWQEQDLDFGDEPTDDYQDRVWDCDHHFDTAKIKLADAFSTHSSGSGMECMRCWNAIHPIVEMPASVGKGSTTTTVALQSRLRGRRAAVPSWMSSRRRLGRRRPVARSEFSLPRSRSMEDLMLSSSPVELTAEEPATTAGYGYISSSASSFHSSFTHVFGRPSSQDSAQQSVLDLYGNPIALENTHGTDMDEQMPDWVPQVPKSDKALKSRSAVATEGASFSFAYECYHCGLLVCHRCQENLEAD